MNRVGKADRKTKETCVAVEINLDGAGESEIATGIGFLDHMLSLFSMHSGFGLKVAAKGDLEVEDHHLVEDAGICLGQALAQALSGKRGINRYGFFILPMDEALCTSAVDLGGRFFFAFDGDFRREKLGELSTENVKQFWCALAENARMNINVRFSGENDHHKCEAVFKCFARALKQAAAIDEKNLGEIPSTKGAL